MSGSARRASTAKNSASNPARRSNTIDQGRTGPCRSAPKRRHTAVMIAVRSATATDAGLLRPMLARAFADDPLIAWALPHPDPDRRRSHAEAWLGWFLDAYLRDGVVDCLEDVAVALWLPPGQRGATPAASAPTLHELLGSLTGHEHATRVLTCFATSGP